MNTQKAVYNRLFSKVEKTELESQKVELGLTQDANKVISALKKKEVTLTKALSSLEGCSIKVQTNIRQST